MKAVIQRVTDASVTVDGQVIAKIGRGILCLIGISTADTEYESEWLKNKILGLKMFPDYKDGEEWGWKHSVMDADYDIICVSQFTLQANLKKGMKPDFHGAMASETSRAFYEDFLAKMRSSYKAEKIQEGKFGGQMYVSLLSDGPCTLLLDSTTDAPAKPVPKQTATAEQKAKAKEKAAKRAAQGQARKAAQGQEGAAGAVNGEGKSEEEKEKLLEEAKGKKEEELIRQAEEKVQDLSQKFESALGHGI
ncbi:hypothetical protein JCM6882_004590 [Rhodosporidiobolus microsporus]